MRTTKHIGIITLRGGEMIEISYAEYEKVLQSFTKSELGKVYIASQKRMIDKTYIVDTQEKWVADLNAVLVEERPEHLIAEKEKIVSDGTGPGYRKFMAMRGKLGKKFGTAGSVDPSVYTKGNEDSNTRADASAKDKN